MKVCPNCSSVMDDNAKICTQCGYQFDAAPSSSGVDLNQQTCFYFCRNPPHALKESSKYNYKNI